MYYKTDGTTRHILCSLLKPKFLNFKYKGTIVNGGYISNTKHTYYPVYPNIIPSKFFEFKTGLEEKPTLQSFMLTINNGKVVLEPILKASFGEIVSLKMVKENIFNKLKNKDVCKDCVYRFEYQLTSKCLQLYKK